MDSQTAHAMALDMPGTAWKEMHGRPMYSVKKRTYMTVRSYEGRAVLKLTVAQRSALTDEYPDAFAPVKTALGKHGWTDVYFEHMSDRLFRYVVDLAWRNVAPKWLLPTRVAPPRG